MCADLVTLGWVSQSRIHEWRDNTLVNIEDLRNDPTVAAGTWGVVRDVR